MDEDSVNLDRIRESQLDFDDEFSVVTVQARRSRKRGHEAANLGKLPHQPRFSSTKPLLELKASVLGQSNLNPGTGLSHNLGFGSLD